MADKKFFLKNVATGEDLQLSGQLLVGRGEGSGLRLIDGNLSRRHAVLTVADGAVTVEDQQSTNGTFVNGVRVNVGTFLQSGDRVKFDIVEFLFRIEGGEDAVDKTILRPMAAAVRAEPPPKPRADAIAASPKEKRPPGWLDSSNQAAGNKTQFKTLKEMEEERLRSSSSAGAPQALTIDVPRLLISEPDGQMLPVQLQPDSAGKSEWTVGCGESRSIRIERSGVSDLHATLSNEGQRWKVVDQVSSNGTFVNGKRCTMSFLSSGDKIAFGPVECTLQLPRRGAAFAGNAGTRRVDEARQTLIGRVLLIGAASFLATIVLALILYRWFRR